MDILNGIIPFGSQYYRAPTPTPEKWERDLCEMSKNGFNTIKIWAQWGWNNPSEGVYDFSDVDTLMDLAHKYNLKVILNIIFDCAPEWFYVKYPESIMKHADGTLLYPRTVGHRSIGGTPGPCYHHGPGANIRKEFTELVAGRYRDHPAMYIWDLWNEPELTSGVARDVGVDKLVCYCDDSIRLFREWLLSKYGSVDRLNEIWHRRYNSFDEVPPPRNGSTFNDMIDWRMFFAETLTGELKLRADAIKAHDTTHPVMTHVVPMPYFNMATACCDDFAMAELCDLFGNSLGSVPFAASWTTSAANGKPCINSEIHAMGGSTLNPPAIPTFDEFKRHIFIPLARGIKGFVFWQYRPESLGLESPAWGLTDSKGAMTDWYRYSIDINDAIQKHKDVLLEVMPQSAEVAILACHKNQIFDFCCTGNISLSYGSLAGIQALLYDANINADIICAEHLAPEQLKKYKAIYCPFPYYMAESTANMLKEYVKNGGTLISEAFFAAYKDDGYHSPLAPGFGMDELFGVCEARVLKGEYIELGAEGAKGMKYQEELDVTSDSAKIFARFQNGAPAAAENGYGEGKAIFIGTLPALCYHHTKDANTLNFVTSILGGCGAMPYAHCTNPKVRVDMLTGKGRAAVVFNNSADKPVRTGFGLCTEMDLGSITDILTGQTIALERENGYLRGKISIKANSCSCFVANGRVGSI